MTDTAYDQDFYAWTQDQARRLREAATARTNLPLDFENLAEEIESMGNSSWKAVQSALARAIEHLLKLEHSPARYPRNTWRKSVDRQRFRVIREFSTSGILRGKVQLENAYEEARRLALHRLKKDRVTVGDALPSRCPYSLDQIIDLDWWPVNRHGIED